MLVDPHVHSYFSAGEGFASPTELVVAAKRRGLDAIALTDHESCAGVAEAIAVGERCGLLVIPGAELVVGRKRHILALGIPESPPPQVRSLRDTVLWVRDQGGITVAAHPFFYGGLGTAAVLCDAIEVHNSCGDRFMDVRAELPAARAQMPRLAGSDAHSADMVGLGRTWVDCDPTLPSVLDAIQSGRTRIAKRTYIPAGQFLRWIDEHFTPRAARRLKLAGAAIYFTHLMRNLLALPLDFLRAGRAGRVVFSRTGTEQNNSTLHAIHRRESSARPRSDSRR